MTEDAWLYILAFVISEGRTNGKIRIDKVDQFLRVPYKEMFTWFLDSSMTNIFTKHKTEMVLARAAGLIKVAVSI